MRELAVPVFCANGHAIYVWGGPMYASPGEVVYWWGCPFRCGECGAACYGGHSGTAA